MRGNSSMHDKMIDGNWALKRKRKRISRVSNLSNLKEGISSKFSRNNPSAKQELEGGNNISRFGCKIKGNDGYFYECVECDLGGNLLCCESCPRTYHLECLNPPLKCTPLGKWQCPKCCKQKDSAKLSRHADTVTKQARTISTVEKSKTNSSLSVAKKASLAVQNSTVEKNKSSNKGKSTHFHMPPSIETKSDSFRVDALCSTKTSHSSDGGCRDDMSKLADIKLEKKLSSPCDWKSTSPHKEAQPSFKELESDRSDKSLETKYDFCKNGSEGKKLIPLLSRSSQKTKKQRQKTKKGDKKKKSRTEKGKHVMITLCKPTGKETSLCPKISGPRQKRSSTGKRISVSTREDPVVQRKLQRLPASACVPLHVIDDLGIEVDKMMKSDENLPDQVQQVDRILGCRVLGIDVTPSKSTQLVKSTVFPDQVESGGNLLRLASSLTSFDTTLAKNHGRLLEDHQDDSKIVDTKDVESTVSEGCISSTNQVDEQRDNEDSNVVLDVHVNRTSQNIECMGELEAAKLAKEFSKDQLLTEDNCRPPEESGNSAHMVGADVKKLSEDNSNEKCICAHIQGNHYTSEPCQLTVDPKDLNYVITETQPNDTAQNRMPKTTVTKSLPIDGDDVMYEFLVKWLGQSNIHNSWVPELQLEVLAKRKLENYKTRYGTATLNICQEQWTQPQRVIALRVSKDGSKEAFTKWCGLPYDECTWEKIGEHVFENSAHLITEFNQFESQTLNKDAKDAFPRMKGDCKEIVSLVEQPSELKGGSLFPHQLEALNWLRKCWLKSKNVILADEMGLGKTISACSFISSLYSEFKSKLPCLVLVPLSTMPNWLAEFSLWAPHLNVVEYHGCAKARFIIRQYEWHASDLDDMSKITATYKFNVLLTTYEMVLADSSYLRGVPWEVLVVDEGHRLKNSESKLFSLLNTFSFQHRVLLTGTPLQNNIGEMYNLLNFLQPVSFPSLSAFEEKFNDLTTAEKVEELKKLVAPHMLRRLKKDAMQNIPPKVEHMVPIELTSIQAEYYRAMLTKNYQILRNIGKGVAQRSMLNIVMQLRKVCNHPYLIPGTEPDSGSVEFLQEMRIKASAKLTLLHSMLKILHKEGHRVLIFSQMTKLLDILEDYLTIEFGPKTFERVDGSVSVADRQTTIDRFNQDKSCFIFLLSTRSCGLGINLATADTVIIYDSDFNPHADIQAMNRAHRIGQSNRLLVYRLVVRASVEERILQLAKKKLMLDQLFVNKSETQKDVEDILRWGTEELFSDSDGVGAKGPIETCNNKAEAVAEGEQKHRKRTGGLGDVYQDRCTDGTNKIIWDESAILKLLDRSNLQSGASEGTDGDLEKDMLGSVKSLEWNDDLNEEQGGSEMLPNTADDGCVGTSEKKEDNVITSIEEDEWDRLLRMRWEKYQSVEEAALGRGKRLRKAVSYKESFAPILSEALSESGNEEEEREPEYTPAGRALKAKYAKLRARQKERLAQREIMEVPCSTENQGRAKVVQHLFLPPAKEEEGNDASKPIEAVRDQTSSSYSEEIKLVQPSEAQGSRSDSIKKLGRVSKHRYNKFQSTRVDLSVCPPGTFFLDILPRHQFQSTSSANPVSTSNQLPVLGLCAPSANQVGKTSENFHSFPSLPIPNYDQRRRGIGPSEFSFLPTSIPEPSKNVNISGKNMVNLSLMPEPFPGVFPQHLKNAISDSYFPFNLCHQTLRGSCLDLEDNSAFALFAVQEKPVLPNLAFHEKTLPEYSFPAMHVSNPHSDLLTSLSLDMEAGKVNESVQDLPNILMVPSFRQQLNENSKEKKVRERPPILTPGQMQAMHSLPENHRKVLDNIMMRTGSGINKVLKKLDTWSEDELDALWIGVRRHGRGNWDAMLRDSKLKFSRHRTSEDLSARWAEEQLKILDGPALPGLKSSKSTFPSIPDGMMTRVLSGSRFTALGTDLPKFCSHLTDIKLTCGDVTAGTPYIEPSNLFGSMVENCPPFLPRQPEKNRLNSPGDSGAGSSDRPGNLSFPSDQPFQVPSRNFSALSTNCSSSSDLKQSKNEQIVNKYLKLPSLLNTSLNMPLDSTNNIPAGKFNKGLTFDSGRIFDPVRLPAKDDTTAGSLKTNKLPHWLQEAVSVPPTELPEKDLPPTVSAIAHSVRLLYGGEKPTIPPFRVPGPPPFLPKDPRISLRKKQKLDRPQLKTPDIASSSKNFDGASSSSIPLPSPFTGSASSLPWADPSSSHSSLNLHPMNLPSPSLHVSLGNKSGMALSPSPKVLHLVASCVAPGPSLLPVPGIPNPTEQMSELPVSKSYELLEPAGKGKGRLSQDLKVIRGKRQDRKSSLSGCWGNLTEDWIDQTESGDLSKTLGSISDWPDQSRGNFV